MVVPPFKVSIDSAGAVPRSLPGHTSGAKWFPGAIDDVDCALKFQEFQSFSAIFILCLFDGCDVESGKDADRSTAGKTVYQFRTGHGNLCARKGQWLNPGWHLDSGK